MTTTTAQGTGGTQTLAVLGVSVRFPHSPYPQQLQLMATIIRSLQNGENGLVESPTGTGKTLCLLCATLAWCEAFALWRSKAALWLDLKDRAGSAAERAALLGDLNTLSMAAFGKPHNESLTVVPGVPRVLYSSRTHSQLSQVVSELKNTSYNVSSSVLGSREQMCINPSVKAAPSAAHAAICRTKVAKKTCEFHVASQKPSIVQGVEAKIMDIEDLVSYGQTQKACPYFLSKEILNKVDITFLPYNYLVDPHTRSQQLELKNSILIFDEGHNLESSCSDASSFDLVTQDLEQAIAEVEICTNIASSSNFDESLLKGLSVNDMGTLKRLISDFIAKIRAMELPKNHDNSLIKPAEFLITLFEELNVKRDTYVLVVKVIDVCLDVLASDLGKMRSRLCLGQFKNALTTTFRVDKGGSSVLDHYRVHIQAIKDIKQPTAAAGRLPVAVAVDSIKLSFWCFSSGVAMQALVGLGVRSVLLASGTLSPLHSFAHELAIPFPNQLENTHVINPSQIFVGVVPKGPSGATLSSSYSNRDNDSYVPDLGNAVVNFVRIVPDGVLVFFTAYKIMRDCIDAWKMPSKKAGAGQKTIWQRMAEHKTLFVEPRDKHEFTAAINEYERTIEQSSGKGAVFFAVCRGKASEGLDFSDRKARAVVICGIPYPASKEPKVILKRGILDHELRTKKAGMSGHDWYAQQAARAVNQAIGRVIRHKNDYGAVLLCDERFSKEHVQGQLPVWVRPNVKVMTQFGDAQSQLTHFFRNMTMNSDWPKPQITAVKPAFVAPAPVDLLRVNAVPKSHPNQHSHNTHSNSVGLNAVAGYAPRQEPAIPQPTYMTVRDSVVKSAAQSVNQPSGLVMLDPLRDPKRFQPVYTKHNFAASFHKTVEQDLAAKTFPTRPEAMAAKRLRDDGVVPPVSLQTTTGLYSKPTAKPLAPASTEASAANIAANAPKHKPDAKTPTSKDSENDQNDATAQVPSKRIRKDAAKDETSKQPTKTRSADSQLYMARAKTLLSPAVYGEFQKQLREHKTQSKSTTESMTALFNEIIPLFLDNASKHTSSLAARAQLLYDFRKFMSQRHWPVFDAKLQHHLPVGVGVSFDRLAAVHAESVARAKTLAETDGAQ